jgi:glycerophosphoryl diester phosphodiesterase
MLVLGHRGASVAAPENTPAAFRLADAMGADGVELDVRRAPDGRVLVAHDPLPAATDRLDRYPTLEDVLDACGERMLVNVEIKNLSIDPDHDPTMAIVGPVIDTLRRRGTADRWLISSFSWSTLEACREADATVRTAWLCQRLDTERVVRCAEVGHVAVHPAERFVTAELVERCHEAGLAVNTWTCNEPDRLVELASFGVDGVCTDVPDVALEALGRPDPDVRPVWARWPRPVT